MKGNGCIIDENGHNLKMKWKTGFIYIQGIYSIVWKIQFQGGVKFMDIGLFGFVDGLNNKILKNWCSECSTDIWKTTARIF